MAVLLGCVMLNVSLYKYYENNIVDVNFLLILLLLDVKHT